MSFMPGIALIFNNRKNREGTDLDVKLLQTTLENINVTVFEPFNFGDDAEEEECDILQVINNFIGRTNFDNYQYVIIAFFSHGTVDEQILKGKQCAVIQKKILNPLFLVPNLQGKLKWLIIQACAGLYDCHLARSDGTQKQREQQKYYLKSFSSHEGCKSYRHLDERNQPLGSIYIHCLCENLNKYAATKDVLSILYATRESIQNYYEAYFDKEDEKEHLTQEPRNTYNFAQKFYFTSGFEQRDEC